MADRFFPLFLGIVTVISGVFTLITQGYYSTLFSRYIDFGKYHSIFGVFVVGVGLLFIYTAMRKKKK